MIIQILICVYAVSYVIISLRTPAQGSQFSSLSHALCHSRRHQNAQRHRNHVFGLLKHAKFWLSSLFFCLFAAWIMINHPASKPPHIWVIDLGAGVSMMLLAYLQTYRWTAIQSLAAIFMLSGYGLIAWDWSLERTILCIISAWLAQHYGKEALRALKKGRYHSLIQP